MKQLLLVTLVLALTSCAKTGRYQVSDGIVLDTAKGDIWRVEGSNQSATFVMYLGRISEFPSEKRGDMKHTTPNFDREKW